MTTHAVRAEFREPVIEPRARPFKIAVFSYGLPCVGEKRSGIEQVAHDLANALADRGHAITVFTYDPQPADARYTTAPLPCRNFVMSRVGRAVSMGYLGNLFALAPHYRDFDVVLAHGDSLLLPLRGRPVVRIMHGSALEEALSATSFSRVVLEAGIYLQELATAFFQRGTVAISANTQRFNPFIHRVIPNGIDRSRFRPDPPVRSRHPSILFVGALTGRKRGSWLLEQFKRKIHPVFPDAELHMVTAPGPAAEGVTYHTGVSANDMVRLYPVTAWIYASPSTYEGFGLPYVEALACGTPIVATSNPGSREVLDDGRFGVLVPDRNFAREIARLLDDAGERVALARNGLIRAAHYDVTRTAAMYKAVIAELVN